MAVQVTQITAESGIHSPFTGRLADETDNPDPSVLMVYYGDAGEYVVLADTLAKAAAAAGIEDPESLDPDNLLQALSISNCVALRVDTGWNGVDYYVFGPAE